MNIFVGAALRGRPCVDPFFCKTFYRLYPGTPQSTAGERRRSLTFVYSDLSVNKHISQDENEEFEKHRPRISTDGTD